MSSREWEAMGWTIGICTLIICITLVSLSIVWGLAASFKEDQNTKDEFPRCHEDQSIQGMGDFKDGLWDYYLCGPVIEKGN